MEYKRGTKKNIPIGTRFGMLVVIGDGDKFIAKCGKSYRGLLCQCDCGTIKNIRVNHLLRGAIKSCGCPRPRRVVNNKKLHNQWRAMIWRCTGDNTIDFKRYKGRGITVCDEWRHSYNNFVNWALSSGWENGLMLDRIDNDGNYTPDNCRFVEPWLSVANRGVARMVEFDGEMVSLSIILHDMNLMEHYANISARLYRGKSLLGAIISQYQLNAKKRRLANATM